MKRMRFLRRTRVLRRKKIIKRKKRKIKISEARARVG